MPGKSENVSVMASLKSVHCGRPVRKNQLLDWKLNIQEQALKMCLISGSSM